MPKAALAAMLAVAVVQATAVSAQSALPDVVILLDTTGDMGGEVTSVQTGFTSTISPTLTGEYPGIAFGVSLFRDFPVSPYGDAGDEPYTLRRPLTTDMSAVQMALNSVSAGFGGDTEESGHEALYQLASGEGISWTGGSVPPTDVAFRPGSRRVAVVITSAAFHESYVGIGSHFASEAVGALSRAGVKVVGVVSNAAARPGLEAYARATGPRIPAAALSPGGQCPTGLDGATRSPDPDGTCPLVFDIGAGGSGLATAFVAAVRAVLNELVFQDAFNAGS